MKPIRVNCPNCSKGSKVAGDCGGLTWQCQQCGNKSLVPFPGIGRAVYFGLKFLKLVGLAVLARAMSDEAAFMFLMLLSVILSITLAVHRGVNIGLKPSTAGLIGLIPGSFFYFAGMPTGGAKR